MDESRVNNFQRRQLTSHLLRKWMKQSSFDVKSFHIRCFIFRRWIIARKIGSIINTIESTRNQTSWNNSSIEVNKTLISIIKYSSILELHMLQDYVVTVILLIPVLILQLIINRDQQVCRINKEISYCSLYFDRSSYWTRKRSSSTFNGIWNWSNKNGIKSSTTFTNTTTTWTWSIWWMYVIMLVFIWDLMEFF